MKELCVVVIVEEKPRPNQNILFNAEIQMYGDSVPSTKHRIIKFNSVYHNMLNLLKHFS